MPRRRAGRRGARALCAPATPPTRRPTARSTQPTELRDEGATRPRRQRRGIPRAGSAPRCVAPSDTGAAATGAADRPRETSTAFALVGLLAVGFVLRLFFIGADGFKNDVATFEAWALTLAEHPLREFFAKAGFADYPPGYFFILWIVGHAYTHAGARRSRLRDPQGLRQAAGDRHGPRRRRAGLRDRAPLRERCRGRSPRRRSSRSIRRRSSSRRIGARSTRSRAASRSLACCSSSRSEGRSRGTAVTIACARVARARLLDPDQAAGGGPRSADAVLRVRGARPRAARAHPSDGNGRRDRRGAGPRLRRRARVPPGSQPARPVRVALRPLPVRSRASTPTTRSTRSTCTRCGSRSGSRTRS